jgi:type II secretory pathway component PulF
MYHTGEITGQLDQTLDRLHRLYQEEATRKLRALAAWTPKLIYFGIMLMIAWRVISFWSGYFNTLNDAIRF